MLKVVKILLDSL